MPKDIDVCDLVGAYPVCGLCGARNVVRDAWAEWSMASGDWVLKTVFDDFACDKCGEVNEPVWKVDKDFRKKRICRLNDALRQGQATNATVVVTAGLKAMGDAFLARTSQSVRDYQSFTEDNDPHGEHDFGAITVEDQKIFWKIDYFDLKLEMHSPDAANPVLTHRVLTIMLASEY
ncbi:DUF3768 domain-containing protein [Pseudohalocynthiibacter sp. F2068]|uniref:DUF3768 domain-containing protein n=1 Tax=Pseudohalocynthiibacter sp. F2068 TaxID=2926418 RepID=UPI001FF21A0C|nr:DUF3768 domain-containing protein [Pseudohalocynthiibacter sp. F2068]MCK0103225.1 DUF3768 domain-containing protein [Pseudohalocynthiibacter sp. F2068]